MYSRLLFFLLIVLRDLAFVVIFSCSFNLFLVLVVFHVSFSRRVLALCPSSLLFFRFLLPFPSLLIVLGYLCFVLVIPCFFFSSLSFFLFLLCPFRCFLLLLLGFCFLPPSILSCFSPFPCLFLFFSLSLFSAALPLLKPET